MKFVAREQRRAVAWKSATVQLPTEAKVPAGYVFKDGRQESRVREY